MVYAMCGGDAAFLSNNFDHLLLLGHIIVLRRLMRPIVTNRGSWSLNLSVVRSVCPSH